MIKNGRAESEELGVTEGINHRKLRIHRKGFLFLQEEAEGAEVGRRSFTPRKQS